MAFLDGLSVVVTSILRPLARTESSSAVVLRRLDVFHAFQDARKEMAKEASRGQPPCFQLGNPNNRGRAYLGKRVAVLPAVVLGLKVAVDGVGRGVLRAADGEGDARGSLGLDLERGGAEGEVLREEVRRRLTNILRSRKERVRVIVRTSGSRSRRPADGATGRPREKSRAAEGQGRTRHETGTKAIVMKS